MHKCIIFLFLLLEANSLYAKNFEIYGNKFQINKIERLADNLAYVEIKPNEQIIINQDDIDFYIFNNLLHTLSLNEFYKICDNDCLTKIFQGAFTRKDYKLSSLSYLMLLNNDENADLKEEAFFDNREKDELLNFYKNLFIAELPTEISFNDKLNEKLAKYCIKGVMLDDSFFNSQITNFSLKNEKHIINNFNRVIKESISKDNSIKVLEKIIQLEGKFLGFSDSYYQQVSFDFNKAKLVLNDIKNIENLKELENIILAPYHDSQFFELLQNEFVKKIYSISNTSLKESMYDKAISALLNVPENKISDKTLAMLGKIFDSSPNDVKLLNKLYLSKLNIILRNNGWIKEKVIHKQELYVKNLIEKWDEENIIEEFNSLIFLRPDINIANDKIRILIAWNAIGHKNHKLSNNILSSICNKVVYLLSFKGIFLFVRQFLWIFFALITLSLLSYILILRFNFKVTNKKDKNSRIDNNKNGNEGSLEEEEKYRKLLKFFDLSNDTIDIKTIKSAYRKKIKKIHPDILGKETKEFLEVQEMYKDLVSLYEKIIKR